MGDIDAADVEALIERVTEECVVLVGRSLGSVIAINAAARAARSLPGIVRGVIAVAPYQRLSRSIAARLIQRQIPVNPVVPIAMGILRMRGVHSKPTTVAAAILNAPLLVIHGAKDPISNIEDAHRIVEAASDGRLIEVSEAAHGDHWDLEGERLDGEVESFLKSVVKCPAESAAYLNQPAS